MSHDLYVNEIFGPTFQGEGPLFGTRAVFLRLAGCNLHCSWCDTKYTWNFGVPEKATFEERMFVPKNEYGAAFDKAAEVHRMPASQVNMKLFEVQSNLVVISGGEPMLQQDALMPIISAQIAAGRTVQFETNGTVLPTKRLYEFILANLMDPTAGVHVLFVVSPKLKSAQAGARASDVDFGAWQDLDTAFKFVCSTAEDLDEVEGLRLDPARVYIMPEGTNRDKVLRTQEVLAPHVLEHGWSLTTRLHTLLWNDARAR